MEEPRLGDILIIGRVGMVHVGLVSEVLANGMVLIINGGNFLPVLREEIIEVVRGTKNTATIAMNLGTV